MWVRSLWIFRKRTLACKHLPNQEAACYSCFNPFCCAASLHTSVLLCGIISFSRREEWPLAFLSAAGFVGILFSPSFCVKTSPFHSTLEEFYNLWRALGQPLPASALGKVYFLSLAKSVHGLCHWNGSKVFSFLMVFDTFLFVFGFQQFNYDVFKWGDSEDL